MFGFLLCTFCGIVAKVINVGPTFMWKFMVAESTSVEPKGGLLSRRKQKHLYLLWALLDRSAEKLKICAPFKISFVL